MWKLNEDRIAPITAGPVQKLADRRREIPACKMHSNSQRQRIRIEHLRGRLVQYAAHYQSTKSLGKRHEAPNEVMRDIKG